MLGFWIANIKW
uniref:Uncharacterized protein n=1 Tax=Lepeophtheirus salmonis TaxID=72036 RepID=A0A0K2TBH5_LEPSM